MGAQGANAKRKRTVQMSKDGRLVGRDGHQVSLSLSPSLPLSLSSLPLSLSLSLVSLYSGFAQPPGSGGFPVVSLGFPCLNEIDSNLARSIKRLNVEGLSKLLDPVSLQTTSWVILWIQVVSLLPLSWQILRYIGSL